MVHALSVLNVFDNISERCLQRDSNNRYLVARQICHPGHVVVHLGSSAAPVALQQSWHLARQQQLGRALRPSAGQFASQILRLCGMPPQVVEAQCCSCVSHLEQWY